MEHLSAWLSPSLLAQNGIIVMHVLVALCVGCVVGYERTFHGRAAGLRTFALVCAAAALLTAATGVPGAWFGGPGPGSAGPAGPAADPTRVIQGIVTGIGFVGAGVIMKDGFSIRGLSTAASIWMTAAIGVVIGLGLYVAAFAATALCVGVMAGFSLVESRLPHHRITHLTLAFRRSQARSSGELGQLLAGLGFRVSDIGCQLDPDGGRLIYDLVLQNDDPDGFDQLAGMLSAAEDVVGFQLTPTRD